MKNTKPTNTQLETDLQSLKTRRTEIARQLTDAQADERSAKEAVIGGASASELQSARTALATLEDIAAELDRRIHAKESELEAARNAQAHAQAVAIVKEKAEQWKANKKVALEQGGAVIASVSLMRPLVAQLLSLADQHQIIVQIAREQGLEASEVGLSFDFINAASLFYPLTEELHSTEQSGVREMLQHYLRFASIGDNSVWSHIRPDQRNVTVLRTESVG